jgi:hypothetical protein
MGGRRDAVAAAAPGGGVERCRVGGASLAVGGWAPVAWQQGVDSAASDRWAAGGLPEAAVVAAPNWRQWGGEMWRSVAGSRAQRARDRSRHRATRIH